MKLLPIAATVLPLTALALAISGPAYADNNEYILFQDGSGNTANADQSDPTISDNRIEQVQIGTTNSVDASQTNGNNSSTISKYQEGSNNVSLSTQDGSTNSTAETSAIGDNNDLETTQTSSLH
ncbi:hypothetical protein ACJJIQ_16050 [Microbulbifer sp. ANSA003]|uniref:hypothetical protein n=1 Tax=Microbulbifer sp. ANSA003 TaxID=3243360 RepID=UPI004041387A